MNAEEMVVVRWNTCDCEYRTKYCDEEHIAGAYIPLSKLNQWIEEAK